MPAWYSQSLKIIYKIIITTIIFFILIFYVLPMPGIFGKSFVEIELNNQGGQYQIFCPSCLKFLLWATGDETNMQSGIYDISQNSTYNNIRQRLVIGDGKRAFLTIKPGDTVQDIFNEFEKNSNILHTNALSNLGNRILLVPMTIYFKPGQSDAEILQYAFAINNKALQQAALDCEPNYKNNFQVIASIIQKESAYYPEYPYIAAVIYNRLAKKMPLQVDVYPKSYHNLGLPKQAIASAGKEALWAACHPANVKDWFYYFAYNGKRHVFSSTYAEHQQLIRRRASVYQY